MATLAKREIREKKIDLENKNKKIILTFYMIFRLGIFFFYHLYQTNVKIKGDFISGKKTCFFRKKNT